MKGRALLSFSSSSRSGMGLGLRQEPAGLRHRSLVQESAGLKFLLMSKDNLSLLCMSQESSSLDKAANICSSASPAEAPTQIEGQGAPVRFSRRLWVEKISCRTLWSGFVSLPRGGSLSRRFWNEALWQLSRCSNSSQECGEAGRELSALGEARSGEAIMAAGAGVLVSRSFRLNASSGIPEIVQAKQWRPR